MTPFFADPGKIAKRILNADDAVKERDRFVDVARAEIGEVKEQMARTLQLYEDQATDAARFKDFYAFQQERLRQLQHDQVRVQSDLDVYRIRNRRKSPGGGERR